MAEAAKTQRGVGGLGAMVLAGLVSITVAAPLLVGGAPPATQLALSVAAFGLVVALLLDREHRLRARPLTMVYVVGALATALQLVPMPLALLSWVSPHAADLRREVGAFGWQATTLDVPATIMAGVRAFLALGVFVVASIVGRSDRRVRALLGAVTLAATLVAVAALVQKLLEVRAVLGVYAVQNWPGSGIWGSFVDGNHAASLFTIGALVAAGAVIEERSIKRVLAALVSVFLVAMTLYTRSRGGAGGLLVGAFMLAAVLLVRRFGARRGVGLAIVFVVVVGAVGALLAEGLLGRLSTGNVADLWLNQKTRGWLAGLRAAVDFPISGVGRGAFEAAAAPFRDDDEGVRLVYPENFIVQHVCELGFVTTAALFWLAVLGAKRIAKYVPRLTPIGVAAVAAVIATWVHELADFGTELPGVAVPLALVTGVLSSRASEHSGDAKQPVRPAFTVAVLATWLALLCAAPWASRHLGGREFGPIAAIAKASPAAADTKAEVDAARRRHPSDGYFELIAAQRALRALDENPLPHLNRAMRLLPTENQAHWLAARVLASQKRRAQAALEYRLAIERRLIPPFAEMLTALGPNIVDAVPQSPESLDRLGREIGARRPGPLVDTIYDRYLLVEGGSEQGLVRAIGVLSQYNRRDKIVELITVLLSEPRGVETYLFAARTAAAIGQTTLLKRILDVARARHPGDARVLLAGAKVWAGLGDTTVARALLRDFPTAATFEQRRDRELIIADIATREGAIDEAAAAKMRALEIDQQLHVHP